MPVAELEPVPIYYELHGHGPPLVVIPGTGTDTRVFAPLVRDLAAHFSVLVFDPRGAGQSGKPDVPYTVLDMADDAAALMDHLGWSNASVLGYSLGGRIALALALARRDLVGRLVLAATSAWSPAMKVGSRRWLVFRVLARVPLPRSVDPQPRWSQARQLAASRAVDLRDRLGELAVPTLVVHGRGDRMVPLRLAEELRDGIPGARLSVLEGSHLSLLFGRRRLLVDEVVAFASG